MTLALYGKTRRRQVALIVIGLTVVLVAMAGGLAALGSDGAQAVAATLNPIGVGCTDEDGDNSLRTCQIGSTVSQLTSLGTPANEQVWLEADDLDTSLGDDDLVATFSLGSYATTDVVATASVRVWSTNIDGAQIKLGWSEPSPSGDARYGTASPGAAVSYSNANLLGDVQGDLGGNFNVWISVDCVPDSNDCDAIVDKVELVIDAGAPPLYENLQARIASSGTANGSSPTSVTVAPGASVSVWFEVRLNGSNGTTEDWDATRWGIGDVPTTCSNAANSNPPASATSSAFSITAPNDSGPHNLALQVWAIDGCASGNSGPVFVLENAINVLADGDGDLVPDGSDDCPATTVNWRTAVDSSGCSDYDKLLQVPYSNSALPQNVGAADFVFVLDRSGSISGQYTTLFNAIHDFVDYFSSNGGDGTYRLVTFGGGTATDAFGGNGYVDAATFLDLEIGDIPGPSGATPTCAGITRGADSGGRPDVPDVLFTLTDGAPTVACGSGSATTNLAAATSAIGGANGARTNQFSTFAIYVGTGNAPGLNSAQTADWIDYVMKALGGGSYTNVNEFDAESLADTILRLFFGDLQIAKSSNGTVNSGEQAEFTITVTNDGTATSEPARVEDPLPPGLSWSISDDSHAACGFDPGDPSLLLCDLPGLAVDEVFTVVVQADLPVGQNLCGVYNNTARLYRDINAPDFIPSTQESVTVQNCTGTISGVKLNDLDGDGAADPGEPGLGDWTIELRADDGGAPGAVVATTSTAATTGVFSFDLVAPGAYWLCEMPQAGWAQTSPGGDACLAVDLVGGETESGLTFLNVKVDPLTVTKTVDTATYDLRYAWTIEKTVDNDDLHLLDGDTGQVTYIIDVDKDAGTPENINVAGTITIANPNGFAVTVTALTDAIGAVPASSLVCLSSAVPANGQLSCSYTFTTLTSIAGGTNTATVTAAFQGIDLSGSGTAPVGFGAPVTVHNDTVTIDDTLAGPGVLTTSASVVDQYDFVHSCSGVVYANGVGMKVVANTATVAGSGLGLGASDGADVDVHCQQKGRIRVDKVTFPSLSSQSFDFEAGGTGFVDFSLTDQATPHDSGLLAPGDYTLTESLPPGWDLTGLSCTTTGGANVIGNSVTLGGLGGTIRLDPGETVTCTYTNTQRGKIIVEKVTQGGDGSFTFSGELTGAIGNGGMLMKEVIPGAYNVTETVPAGWDLTGISCSDANSSGNTSTGQTSFNVEAGETVTCTYTNTLRGSIAVRKLINWMSTVNPPATTFTVCIDGPGPDGSADQCSPALGHDQTHTFTNLLPGAYAFLEVHGEEWLSFLPPNEVLAAGEAATADVTNVYVPGSLGVTKTVDLGGALPAEASATGVVTFEVCATGPNAYAQCRTIEIDLTTGTTGTATFENLYHGIYTVTETAPADVWAVTDDEENATDRTVTGVVEAGELVEAGTFTNTLKAGDLTIAKTFDWGVPGAFQPEVTFAICIKGPSAPNGTEACRTVTKATTSVSWAGLIPGTYLVGEFLTSGAVTPVDSLDAWDVDFSAASVHVEANGDGSPAAATVTNIYQPAALEVTKTVVANGQAVAAGETTQICIQLLDASNQPAAEQDPICHTYPSTGGPFTFANLIPGSYRVNEVTPDPGNATDKWGVSGSGVVVAANAGETGSHEVINTVLVGDLNVTKTIDWNLAPPDSDQVFELCITGPSHPERDCIEVGPGSDPATMTASWSGLQVGDYTITELYPDEDGDDWDSFISDAGTVTVSNGTPQEITVVNTLKSGSIVVRKVYDFPGGTPAPGWQPLISVGGDAIPPGEFDAWPAVEVAANTQVSVAEQMPAGWVNIDIQYTGQCGNVEVSEVAGTLLQLALSLIGLDTGQLSLDVASTMVAVPPGGLCEVTFTNAAVGTVEVVKNDNTVAAGAWNFAVDAPGGDDFDRELSIAGDGIRTLFPLPMGSYTATETNPGLLASIAECPEPNPTGAGVYASLATPFGTTLDAPGDVIRFEFTNTSCPVVLATGSLIIEKWNDLDGDGERDEGEGPIQGWPFTIAGPQFGGGGQSFSTDDDGRIVLNGITAGFYNITEGAQTGWYVTGLRVNGAQRPVSSTTEAEVIDDSLSETVDTLVEFGNRQTGAIRVVKVVNDEVGDATVAGWAFTLTGCGLVQTETTGAAGTILWSNLKPCSYSITEQQAGLDGFSVAPGASQSANPGPAQTLVLTFTNSRLQPLVAPPPPTATPTNTPTNTPTATPTNTPVPPTNTPAPPTPTETPTNTPVSAVQGSISTPTPTATGTPTDTPTPTNTPVPTATPSPTATPTNVVPPDPQPPAAGDGFTRVVLGPNTGYLFIPPGPTGSGFNIFWDGTRLTGADGTRFATPEHADTPGDVGVAPSEGFLTTSVVPSGDMVIHLSVPGESGPATYTIWIPPDQGLGQEPGPLTFDWKVAEFAPVAGPAPLPEVFEEVNHINQFFEGGVDVASTNLAVTVGVLLLLLAGASVFNEALEENVRGIGVRSFHLPGPLGAGMGLLTRGWHAIAAVWAAIVPGATFLDKAIGPAALLLGTGFIYSLLEPGFGWNEQSFTLFVSLVVSQGVLVLFYEGGKAWLYRRNLRVDAGLRLFPACILIALVSVVISRVAGFQPGFVIGFVAAAIVLGQPDFTQAERGRAWALVASAMLGVSILAWILAIPLHELYKANPNVWTGLPEAIAIAVFVVCLEGLLFSLIPLEFMDGWRIWKWSPVAWIALFVPSVFLFIQILFNEEEAYLDLIASQKSISGLIILFGYLGLTFGTWAYFRWRVERGSESAEAGEPGA